MGLVPAFARPHAACVLVLAAVAACTEPNTAPPDVVEHVVQRLGPTSFDGVPHPRHGPVVPIGDEARSVIVAPQEVVVAEPLALRPRDGQVSTQVSLPPELAEAPGTAFLLSVQELPFTQRLEPAVMAKVARENFSLRRTDGWQLRRSASSNLATLELDHPGNQDVQLNLRLTALLPTPSRLESNAFPVPDDARLSLGFGVAGSADTSGEGSVRFQAALHCEEEASHVLIDAVLSSEEIRSGWHDRTQPLGPARPSCRLHLTTDGHPSLVRSAVWAVPQIRAASSADPAVNLLLISLDTLRGDHLSGLGYPRQTTPVIDAELVAKGTTFSQAVSTFPQTDVSHLSLFTGLYPMGQPTRGRVSRHDALELLAERLQDAGFETAAFTEDALVSGAFGFWFGFDEFTERAFAHEERGERTMADGIRYLEAHRDRRFFLFLHTYKTHDPFVPGDPFEALWTEADQWEGGGPAPQVPAKHRELLDRYDRTIREADTLVGRVLATLDRLGIADRTLVVLTSDHGEAFGEHGIAGHGFTPHREALHVPLILRGPGIERDRRISTPVSIADLAPTLVELFGLAPMTPSQGASLAPALRGEALDDRPLFFSWLREDASGVREGEWTYHRTANGRERFDLGRDPGQERPERGPDARGDHLLTEHAARSEGVRTAAGPGAGVDEPTIRAVDPRLEKSLEALGYLR